jgi:hypothetical protein
MFRLVLAFYSLAIVGSVSAQSEKGSLTGTISDPNGVVVDEAPIQVKNKTTGAMARTSSKSDGRYTLAGLAPGTYEFSIVMPCCAYREVTQDLALEAGKTAQLNIRLVETVNGTTLGDDPGRLAKVDAEASQSSIPARATRCQRKAGFIGGLGGHRRSVSGRAADAALGRRRP